MHITQLTDALAKAAPANFIWGAGCSSLYRATITMPSREIYEAVKKYDADPLLSEIKRRFFHRTAGLENVHSCLMALRDFERREVLTARTNWADICMAELLRTGRAARVLTTNFDGSLVRATATFRMLLPLYGQDYPELRDAATPCVYVLGDASPSAIASLIQRGSATGPWIVIGTSARHFGLTETLVSIDRFDHGLYWIGHFHEEPPQQLRERLFSADRNAHWISGFDADSFMLYLLRALGHFPPPLVADAAKPDPDRALQAFERQRPPAVDLRPVLAEVERIQRADPATVAGFLEKLAHDEELAARGGHPALALGTIALNLSEHRSPREVKPALLTAARLMEPLAPKDVMGNFAQVCSKLAQFSRTAEADGWYARADRAFAQMDFGPSSGAIVPRGHLLPWMNLLAEWACYEARDESEALFSRAIEKFREALRSCDESADPARAPAGLMGPFLAQQRATSAKSERKRAIREFTVAVRQRARTLPPLRAQLLLAEARPPIEELRTEAVTYSELLTRHLFRQAEVTPEREAALRHEAETHLQQLLVLAPKQRALIFCTWASCLGELAMARTGESALALYAECHARFDEAEKLDPNLPMLHMNWSSFCTHEARERGDAPEIWDRARRFAERANSVVPGKGSYNLACIAAERADRSGIERWLLHSAEYGKIPRLSHVRHDISFRNFHHDPWFLRLLDLIFDAKR